MKLLRSVLLTSSTALFCACSRDTVQGQLVEDLLGEYDKCNAVEDSSKMVFERMRTLGEALGRRDKGEVAIAGAAVREAARQLEAMLVKERSAFNATEERVRRESRMKLSGCDCQSPSKFDPLRIALPEEKIERWRLEEIRSAAVLSCVFIKEFRDEALIEGMEILLEHVCRSAATTVEFLDTGLAMARDDYEDVRRKVEVGGHKLRGGAQVLLKTVQEFHAVGLLD